MEGKQGREKVKNYYPYSNKTYFLNNYNLLLLLLLALGLFLGHWKGGAITGRSCVYLRVGILKMGWFCFCFFFFEHGCEGWWQQQFDSKAAESLWCYPARSCARRGHTSAQLEEMVSSDTHEMVSSDAWSSCGTCRRGVTEGNMSQIKWVKSQGTREFSWILHFSIYHQNTVSDASVQLALILVSYQYQ